MTMNSMNIHSNKQMMYNGHIFFVHVGIQTFVILTMHSQKIQLLSKRLTIKTKMQMFAQYAMMDMELRKNAPIQIAAHIFIHYVEKKKTMLVLFAKQNQNKYSFNFAI